jgi:hypothetical protein
MSDIGPPLCPLAPFGVEVNMTPIEREQLVRQSCRILRPVS